MRNQLLCISLIFTVDCVLSARILAVLPVPAKSHHNMFQAVLKTLAGRGHEVVSYTSVTLEKPVSNYTEVFIDGIESPDKKITKDQFLTMMNLPEVGAAKIIWFMAFEMTETLFKNEKIKGLLESKEKKFDLIILEPFFGQEALLGFGHLFNAPVICLHPFGSFSLINKASGNSLALSYIPDFSFSTSNHMTFYERLLNSYSILSTLFLYYYHFLPYQDVFMRKVFQDPTMPPLSDMINKISLFVNNAQPNVHYAQPYTPNLISVGGLHLAKDRKPLPPDMKKFLDEAKHGVIYVSLGSIISDHLLPSDFYENFIKVFRRLPQRVLWKTNSQHAALPDNVLTAKWMPQQDVLAHPNIAVFVTHGGIFGQLEAINAGVPVVCIPFFGDQPMNAMFYEAKGVGVKLSFKTLSEESIYTAVTTILHNTKYKDNMKKLSSIYRDRPVSPADSLVFWVEYVLRHGGAHHLRPASAALPWYKLFLVDVIAAILTAVILLLTVLYLIVRKIFRIIKPSKSVLISKKTD